MKKTILIINLLLLIGYSPFSLKGQGCGTEPTKEQIQYMTRTREIRQNGELLSRSPEVYKIPIKVHIVRETNGSGGLELDVLMDAIERTNGLFRQVNMQFFVFGNINYIDNSEFFHLNQTEEPALADPNDRTGAINLYCVETLTDEDGDALCGYAYYPWSSRDRIMMDNDCMNRMTFMHEIGHYFSLYHTHGKSNDELTDELVNGSNCMTAGDDICDTPADPNLLGEVSRACFYNRTIRDRNRDIFRPLTNNIMSYARDICRTRFTQDQYVRMYNSLLMDRNYLICEKPLPNDFILFVTGSEIYRSTNPINSLALNMIFNGGEAVYISEASINLRSGFAAINGANFQAMIGGVGENGCNSRSELISNSNSIGRQSLTSSNLQSTTLKLDVFPNPFTTSTTIQFEIPQSSAVSLTIRNTLGQTVAQLAYEESLQAGSYKKNFSSEGLPAGLYLCVLEVNGEQHVKKLLLRN